MSSILFGISLAALLSTTSFLIVLLRVSPLTAPFPAVTAFVVSLVLSVTTVSILIFYGFWKYYPSHTWDEGRIISISLRQGIFLGLGTFFVLIFLLLELLTWWILLLIYGIFLLIELALDH